MNQPSKEIKVLPDYWVVEYKNGTRWFPVDEEFRVRNKCNIAKLTNAILKDNTETTNRSANFIYEDDAVTVVRELLKYKEIAHLEYRIVKVTKTVTMQVIAESENRKITLMIRNLDDHTED